MLINIYTVYIKISHFEIKCKFKFRNMQLKLQHNLLSNFEQARYNNDNFNKIKKTKVKLCYPLKPLINKIKKQQHIF